MSTKISPTWIFRLLILAALILGAALRFGAPVLSVRILEHPPTRFGKRVVVQIDRHQHVIEGAAEIAKGLGEALVIAAILAVIVDPYAKFRLGKEIGREIARETAGQHLPEELRQALENIEDITLYQQTLVIDVALEKADSSPDLLRWQTAMHFEIKNASWNKRPFEHRVSISDSAAERKDGKIIEVWYAVDGKRRYDLKEPNAELTRMCSRDKGITSFRYEHSQSIASTRLGTTHKYEYGSVTERQVPQSEVQVIQMILPTAGIELTVRHPEGLIIHTSLEYTDGVQPQLPDGAIKGHASQWKSERAYLTNEHIWIMYENPKKKPAAGAATQEEVEALRA